MKAELRLQSLLTAAAAIALAAPAASAGVPADVHALVIGNNQAPDGDLAGTVVPPLRFADDDAAAFFDLLSKISSDNHLLTVMDAETQAVWPNLAAVARPPTMAEVRTAVATIADRVKDDRRRGRQSTVFMFFSGHGAASKSGDPIFTLADGGISNQILYEEILSKIPADYVHVIIDACNAEGVVRPRTVAAQPVGVSATQADAILSRSTLRRFPNTGAILATAVDAEAHEWDRLQHGVFTYELLSALRGAADVNHDRKIEYSEISAFLSAANRAVSDPRARMAVLVRPPDVNARVPLVDLANVPKERAAWLTGISADAGLIELEDDLGRRVATLRGEHGFVADLFVPPDATVFVRNGAEEARLSTRPGQSVAFQTLAFRGIARRARGAADEALRHGLFARAFGPGYYTGFIDGSPDLIPVPFPEPDHPVAVVGSAPPASAEASRQRSFDVIVGVGASVPVVALGTAAESVRIGLRPRQASGAAVSVDLFRAAQGEVREWRFVASGGWLWSGQWGRLRSWAGPLVGAGVAAQTAADKSTRDSGLLTAAATLGAAVNVTRDVGLWTEGEVEAVGYRRAGRVAWSAVPAAWIGSAFAF